MPPPTCPRRWRQASSSCPAPQGRKRSGPDALAQGHGLIAVVQQHAHFELITCQAGQFSQAAQVSLLDGGGSLDLDTDQLPYTVLDHDVDLELVSIAVVHEATVRFGRAGVLEQFAKDKRFQDVPELGTILLHRFGSQVELSGQQSWVDELQLRGLDDPVEAVTRSDIDPLEQVHLFKDAHVARYGLAVQSHLTA